MTIAAMMITTTPKIFKAVEVFMLLNNVNHKKNDENIAGSLGRWVYQTQRWWIHAICTEGED
jgi:hypothetical protein